ncbi:thrombospondin type 3 repeat-containing protein [Christiangramia echinicola]|uniref:Thrombospondin type 3 repeat-containing protein n=1 Tax=Christiangramia echinicola TaxID=279359 RepID=A0A1H1KVP1_9FLAO|nr:thrombospondin type 3 repeat-containing protein [Christiangramia echinicola]SDR66197.1 Thrombospondin type 3 repeat-containing protein [Christiangramia echinicola]
MKRLNLLGYLILIIVLIVSCEKDALIENKDSNTQLKTISDPNAKATITPEKIKALGQQNQNKTSTGNIIVLDFEGLGDVDYINDFYNGGTSSLGNSGTDYGVEFGVALSIIDEDAGGTGNFANEPSPSTVMFFLDENQAYMNVEAGFDTGFSFYYSSSSSGSVSVYDGLNGNGNLLGTVDLPDNLDPNCIGDPNGTFCSWDIISVAFNGIAQSVVFNGAANYIGFDDVTFGSLTPGNSDSDGDGVNDDVDNCPNTANSDQADNDSDGMGDVCDADDDDDGILDVNDNCPFTDNPGQKDNDGDGMGDACDDDDDDDGVLDANDNCPFTANTNQEDFDVDGLGDVCDADDDNDGCLDGDDSIPFSNIEATVVIDGCDSDVDNRVTSTCGLTMSDMIDNLEAGIYKNHGEFVRMVSSLTRSWVKDGLISKLEKDAIMSCAGSANIP